MQALVTVNCISTVSVHTPMQTVNHTNAYQHTTDENTTDEADETEVGLPLQCGAVSRFGRRMTNYTTMSTFEGDDRC